MWNSIFIIFHYNNALGGSAMKVKPYLSAATVRRRNECRLFGSLTLKVHLKLFYEQLAEYYFSKIIISGSRLISYNIHNILVMSVGFHLPSSAF